MSSGPLVYDQPKGDVAEYLQKYFTHDFRTGYVDCKGFILPDYFRNFGDSIREMDIRPDDVWVCSIPKAGKFYAFKKFVENSKRLRYTPVGGGDASCERISS